MTDGAHSGQREASSQGVFCHAGFSHAARAAQVKEAAALSQRLPVTRKGQQTRRQRASQEKALCFAFAPLAFLTC